MSDTKKVPVRTPGMKMYSIYPRYVGGPVAFIKADTPEAANKLAHDAGLLPGIEAFVVEEMPGAEPKHEPRPEPVDPEQP